MLGPLITTMIPGEDYFKKIVSQLLILGSQNILGKITFGYVPGRFVWRSRPDIMLIACFDLWDVLLLGVLRQETC